MVPESHFARVLHTNYNPSTKELNEIRHLVIEPQERIRRLNEEISRLQTERDELQRFVDGHLALAAPFRRFPADIWGEIFAHCLPVNKMNVAVCTVKEAPLLLTAICRDWREIALNTPRLWSSVHLSVSSPPPTTESDHLYHERQEATLQGMKLWLDRSGSRPLTLSIHIVDNTSPPMSPGEFDDESTICSKLMNLLVGYSRRWKSLSLGSGVKPSHQRALEGLIADDVPLLETVHTGDVNLFTDFHTFFNGLPPITGMPQVPEPRPAPASKVLCKLSSLRSLHLQQGSMSSLRISLSWSQLTKLTFNFRPMTFDSTPSPIAVLQKIAQACRSLVILTFRSHLSPGGSPTDPINWSTLQELRLVFNGPFCDYPGQPDPGLTGPFPFLPHVKDIYSSIIAPQLLRLTLLLVDHRWGGPAVDRDLPFHTLIKGAPHLTHLQIIGYHILGAEALSRCLQAAPSLTILKLQPERSPRWVSCDMGYRALRMPLEDVIVPPPDWVPQLLASLNELGSCPQLEVLDCGRCRIEDVTSILEFFQDESRLSRMKEFRADMGELVVQQVHTMTSPSLSESLRSLRAAHGISVDLKWGEIEPDLAPQWRMNPYSGLSVPATSPWEGESDW
ncbi:hypothetical protein PQX77_015917 [Marasmius sp. AFHP31]|nr:hypothetical protein PQX77_015917 [Marasmius sp. AFHP31]